MRATPEGSSLGLLDLRHPITQETSAAAPHLLQRRRRIQRRVLEPAVANRRKSSLRELHDGDGRLYGNIFGSDVLSHAQDPFEY